MSIREGLKAYYSIFGLGGVLAITTYRLIGTPKELKVHPSGIRNPVHIRIRTSDTSTYSDILLRGQYDFNLPFSPRTIVDAGANIGMSSIYFTHKYPEARIIAIEPEASNFELLARNVKPYSAITPIHAALWSQDGEINVSDPNPDTGPYGKWAFVTKEGPGIPVRAITMRTLMVEMGIRKVDLLKVDIEGAEIEVFGSCDWIQDIRCLVIELHDRFRFGCSETVNAVMRGFKKVQHGEMTYYFRLI